MDLIATHITDEARHKPGTLPEPRALFILFSALAILMALAMISKAVFVDNQDSVFNAAPRYLGFAARNGGFFLFIVATLKLLQTSRQTEEQSVFSYLLERFDRSAIIKTFQRALLGGLSFAAFMFAYTTIKTRIPEIAPFRWDYAFMRADQFLFLGHDPWTLFAWVYDFPFFLRMIDFVYDVWAAILVGIWIMCFVTPKYSPEVRYKFPLAIVLTWFIGGNIFAALLSSAGPCYYGAVTGLADPYSLQMSKLAAIDAVDTLSAVQYQKLLWSVYEQNMLGLGGISAMPSMHCATSILFVMMMWNHKTMRYVALAFAIFIFLASFILAWHYAVDGLVAIPITLACWYLAEKILNTVCEKPKRI